MSLEDEISQMIESRLRAGSAEPRGDRSRKDEEKCQASRPPSCTCACSKSTPTRSFDSLGSWTSSPASVHGGARQTRKPASMTHVTPDSMRVGAWMLGSVWAHLT